jgi:pyridoxamine 5'-phosphate oxidase
MGTSEEPQADPLALDEAHLSRDPLILFSAWFEAARRAQPKLPESAVLATASADGTPSARVVLVKDVSETGFVFYTNYESRKARDLATNPRAALVFYWAALDMQVRVEGVVELSAAGESDSYFSTRPVESCLGAWASPQSQVIESRAFLERRFAEFARQYAGSSIPRPPHWGGYRLIPRVIEFWRNRPSRLHDRIRYTRGETGPWRIERLAP